MVYVLTFALILFLTYIFVFFEPLSKNFPEWTDKATVIQTIFTVFASIIAILGIGEYIKKSRLKINPKFILTPKPKYIIYAEKFPLTYELPFYVKNDGNIAIEKHRVYYKLFIRNELRPTNLSGLQSELGELVPKQKKRNELFDAFGGIIPAVIFPKRSMQLFSIALFVQKPGTHKFLFYFNSDVGFFPSKMKFDEEGEPVSGLGELEISFKVKK